MESVKLKRLNLVDYSDKLNTCIYDQMIEEIVLKNNSNLIFAGLYRTKSIFYQCDNYVSYLS
jgi:hypothetical protein